MTHVCHAKFCETPVPPRLFMCKRHWYALPKRMRDRLWSLYVSGQEDRKDPTAEYLSYAQECIDWLARIEGM